MLRRLLIGLTLVSLSIACTPKKPAENPTTPGDTAADQTITSAPLSFSPQGSDSGTIDGLKTIHFDYDKSSITEEGKKILAENATWIKNHNTITMQVEGHCDEHGSIEYNLALGERRAKAVKAYLVSLGVEASKVTIISYGKEKKIDDGEGEAADAKNRRANFLPMN